MQLTGTAGQKGASVSESFAWYVGIDWGNEAHLLCLMDATGTLRGTRLVAHAAVAVHDAIQWVLQETGATPDGIAVGLERPRGVLVDTWLERGFPLFAVNPKQLDRFRDRFTAGGAKDDRRDAHAVADALRTDRRAFRRIQPDAAPVIQLREWCRIVEELHEEEQRLANRLREQLYRVDAAWLTLCPAANEPWLWTVLADTPHPAAWPTLSRRRLASMLRAHRIRRLTVDEVIAAVRQPRLHAAAGVAEAVEARIASLVPPLRLVHAQRTVADRRIEQGLASLVAEAPDAEPREHRDAEILQSLPGVGRMVAATMLTEATGPLADRDYVTLRAHAGTAPITKRSGKRAAFVHMRYACKPRLRQALYHWARTSIQHDQTARAYYDTLRARGHHHARALRSVADRWLRILIAMLRAGTLYDASRFAQAIPRPV